MVHQCRTSEEPENAADYFKACACQALSACSHEGHAETKPSQCKVCNLSEELNQAELLSC